MRLATPLLAALLALSGAGGLLSTARAQAPGDCAAGTAEADLAVSDVRARLGREVAVLLDGAAEAGRHAATLDGARLASGLYVVVLTGGDGVLATAKVTLLR